MNGRKAALRQEFLRARRAISAEERTERSAKILTQLTTSVLLRDREYILSYAPLPDEADILAFREFCYATGKRIAFPKVVGENIEFYETRPEDTLAEGVFHVNEPVITEEETPVDWDSAVCLVPGVAFDGYGTRYGYGKGYYDRYLSAHNEMLRIGVAFRLQVSENRLPCDPTDVRMHYLLTEDGIAQCAPLY